MNVEIIETEIDEITEKYKLKPSELALAVHFKPKTIMKSDLYMLDLLNKIKEKKKKEMQILSTKSENIITKLKEIKAKAIKANDPQSVEDIDWIITSINDQNLYEIDTKDINIKIHSETNTSGIQYLMQYSKIEDSKQKEKDFSAIRRSSRSFRPSLSLKVGGLSLAVAKKSRFGNDKHDERDKMLKLISSPEFNLFSLDTIDNGKGPISVLYVILNDLDLVKKGILPNDILKAFVIKVSEGYSRTNAIYHNDLHVADVTQTLYSILTNGNLVTVLQSHITI